MRSKKIKIIFTITTLSAIILLYTCHTFKTVSEENNDISEENVQNQIAVNNVSNYSSPITMSTTRADYSFLGSAIREIIGDEADKYSVYYWFSNYQGEDNLIINNQSRRSASMIKVFIMSYAMEKASIGELNLDNTLILRSADKVGGAGVICGWSSGTAIKISTLIELMITESDNTATNMMIDYLGMENINQYIVSNGYNDSIVRRKMMDFDAVAAGHENYSSVADLGKFFTKLYNHECVNAEYDEMMIGILKKQTDLEVLPSVLPCMEIAHKTGELDNLYDDGGIVFSPNGNFVIVIMNDGIARYNAVDKMKQIVKVCYDNTYALKG